ncbi:alpha-tubulin suppressor protein Aats1 [Aspergillus tubingensis]|uniref:alpha-tubulin suppressor protein Aats1 n=1 Tax=Aspergillus tubingensis TaxID=5068 RepID=UPI0015788E3C|nr:alpha-tubulin suppressor protein Aats1 [Aspergillus tubingensis]GFN20518.1 alpha-tubulin suppressor protein Aats1 [Aspergillus tubingensis]
MPHLPIVQCNASITAQNIRKRKRETALEDITPALSNRLASSALHDTSPQFCLDNTACLGDSAGVFTRQRCLHRKRRVFQQPPAYHKPPFIDALRPCLLKQSPRHHISNRKHYSHLRPVSAHVISATGDRPLENMLTPMQTVIFVVGGAATFVYGIVTLWTAVGYSGPLQAAVKKGRTTTNGRQSGHEKFALPVRSKVSPNREKK